MKKSPRVEIEYCTQCRWLLRAAWMAQELLTTFTEELGEVTLTRNVVVDTSTKPTGKALDLVD